MGHLNIVSLKVCIYVQQEWKNWASIFEKQARIAHNAYIIRVDFL